MLKNVVENVDRNVVKCKPIMLWNVRENVDECHRMLTNVAKC